MKKGKTRVRRKCGDCNKEFTFLPRTDKPEQRFRCLKCEPVKGKA